MVEICSVAGSSNNRICPVCASTGFISVHGYFRALVQPHSGCCALHKYMVLWLLPIDPVLACSVVAVLQMGQGIARFVPETCSITRLGAEVAAAQSPVERREGEGAASRSGRDNHFHPSPPEGGCSLLPDGHVLAVALHSHT